MVTILNKTKKFFCSCYAAIKNFLTDVLSSTKKSIYFTVGLVFSILFFMFIYMLIVNNSFYNNWSDDILQYYPITTDFLTKLKSGNLSWYNLNNYLGASFFSDSYYVPLDIFTFITLALSYLMNIEIAYSATELLKIVFGVAAIMYFLKLRGYSPKVIVLAGLLYFASGGIANFMAFPVFLSLAFYLPCSLIVVHYFISGNKWAKLFLPIFAFLLVLYNFYNAYAVFAFMAFAYVVMGLLDENFKISKYLINGVLFFLLIVLGVLMSMVIFYPSALFIVEATSRDESADIYPPFAIKNSIKAYADVFFEFVIYLSRLVIGAINPKNNFSFTEFGEYAYECQIRFNSTFNASKEYLFDFDLYYRIITKSFTPANATGFYGYLESYATEHVSLYITGVGALLSSYVFFMKGKKSRILQLTLIGCLIMMIVPIFSYVFSGSFEFLNEKTSTSVPYTRWINFIPLVEIVVFAYVLENKKKDEGFNKGFLLLLGIFFLIVVLGTSYYHLDRLADFESSFDSALKLYEEKMFYYTVACVGLLSLYLVVAYLFYRFKVKKRFYPLTLIPGIAVIILLLVKLVGLFNNVPIEAFSTESGKLFSIDSIRIDQYLMILTLVIILISIFCFSVGKQKIIVYLVVLEVIISTIYSFATPLVYGSKVDSFKQMHEVSDFLDENLEQDEFYRVFVDSSAGMTEKTNFCRMTKFFTNTEIFHSFTDSETDALSKMLFNTTEHQTKTALNTFSYYLNVFLGYKYVVVSQGTSGFASEIYNLVAENDKFVLYEFKDYQGFNVYENYVSLDDYDRIGSKIALQKLLIENAVIDLERFETVLSEHNLSFVEADDVVDSEIKSNEISTYKSVNSANKTVLEMEDGFMYYRYEFNNEDSAYDQIGYINGAIYIKAISWLKYEYAQELVNNDEIFIEYKPNDNGEITYDTGCTIAPIGYHDTGNYTIHCPFYGEVKYLYIKADNQEATVAKSLDYRLEEAIGHDDGNYYAYLIFDVADSPDKGIIDYSLSDNSSMEYVLFETVDGERYSAFPNQTYFDKKIVRIFVYKNGELYEEKRLPTITAYFSGEIAERDNKLAQNQLITVEGNKISLSYSNISLTGNDQLVVIPTTYSEEWKMTKGDYDVISASGGFIGIIIPGDVQNIEIVLEYVPNGLKTGALLSIAGFALYGIILGGTWYYQRIVKRKRGNINEENINNSAIL